MTPKQAAFVREYMIDGNATQAAIRAGYSERTAQEQSSRLLSKAMIREGLAALQAETAERHEITLDRLTEMAEKAYDAALKANQVGAAVSAVAQLSRMHGFDADPRKNERSPLDGMNVEQLRAIRSALGADASAASGTRH